MSRMTGGEVRGDHGGPEWGQHGQVLSFFLHTQAGNPKPQQGLTPGNAGDAGFLPPGWERAAGNHRHGEMSPTGCGKSASLKALGGAGQRSYRVGTLWEAGLSTSQDHQASRACLGGGGIPIPERMRADSTCQPYSLLWVLRGQGTRHAQLTEPVWLLASLWETESRQPEADGFFLLLAGFSNCYS